LGLFLLLGQVPDITVYQLDSSNTVITILGELGIVDISFVHANTQMVNELIKRPSALPAKLNNHRIRKLSVLVRCFKFGYII